MTEQHDESKALPALVGDGVPLERVKRLPMLRSLSLLGRAALTTLMIIVVAVVLLPIVIPFDPTTQSLTLRNHAPFTAREGSWFPYVLGTDNLGRDVFIRLLYGGRTSLMVGALAVLISGTIGVVIGMVSAYRGGWVDALLLQVMDVMFAFPSLVLALFVLFVAGPSLPGLIIVLAVTRWMIYARVARSLVLPLRTSAYVEAARLTGAKGARILFRHVLPNIAPSIVVLSTLEVAAVVLAEAGLSFLGLGVQPPGSSWGLMIADARGGMTTAWWGVTFPGLALLLTIWSVNVLAQEVQKEGAL